MDDSFALSMARQQSFASLLTLLGAYREELDYTVLSNLIAVMITYALCLGYCVYGLSLTLIFTSQICYKLARIAADAVPELLNLIKQSFISLFQYSAE